MSRIALNRFPALPASVSELIRLTPDDPSFYDRVLQVCEADAGFASELIRLAHSVDVGLRSPVDSVRQALLLVGPKPAVSHLVGGALVKVFVPHAPVVRELWERSVWTATAAERFATDLGGVDPYVARAVALLHDLGQFAMACADQDAYAAVLEECTGDQAIRLAREREMFGEDHTQVGARLAATWAFPHLFRLVIRHHHDDEFTGPEGEVQYVRIVALADAVEKLREDDDASRDRAERRAAAAGLHVAADDLLMLRSRLDAASRADIRILGLSPVT